MANPITDIVAGAGEAVAKIISLFKVDPNQAAANATELEKIKLDLAGKMQASIDKEVESAASIIRAEAAYEDKYTSRARPTFMYVVEAILGMNLLVIPGLSAISQITGSCFGKTLPALTAFPLPSEVLWLFGVCITGYVGFRSFEKFMAMPGNSQAKLPFGVTLGNDTGKK